MAKGDGMRSEIWDCHVLNKSEGFNITNRSFGACLAQVCDGLSHRP